MISVDEEAAYSYLLDDEEVDATYFTDLSEREHTFQVTATDEAGNSSTETYAWTTDYTSLVITMGDPPQLDLDILFRAILSEAIRPQLDTIIRGTRYMKSNLVPLFLSIC